MRAEIPIWGCSHVASPSVEEWVGQCDVHFARRPEPFACFVATDNDIGRRALYDMIYSRGLGLNIVTVYNI